MLAASCSRTHRLDGLIVALEPTTALGWTAGPASSPGRPAIPTPESCALGIKTFDALVRAIAGSVVMLSANMIALIIFIFFIMVTSVATPPFR
jgi:hypothetical protein